MPSSFMASASSAGIWGELICPIKRTYWKAVKLGFGRALAVVRTKGEGDVTDQRALDFSIVRHCIRDRLVPARATANRYGKRSRRNQIQ